MRTFPLLPPLMLVASISAAAEDAWVTLASSDDEKWQAKSTSFELVTGADKKPAAALIGRVLNQKESTIELHRWQVYLKDCEATVGSLRVLSLKGDLLFESDFVEDGGTVASRIAETICRLAERNAQRNSG